MMKLKRPVAALLAAVLLLGLLSGCHRENGVSFRVAMGSVPATLDPALAATDEEKTVVSHLFENLMKLQSDGSGGTQLISFDFSDNTVKYRISKSVSDPDAAN